MINIVDNYTILTEEILNTGQYQTKIKKEQPFVVVETYSNYYNAVSGHAKWTHLVISGSVFSKKPFYNPHKHQWQLFL